MPQLSQKSVDKTGYWCTRFANFFNTGLHPLSTTDVIDKKQPAEADLLLSWQLIDDYQEMRRPRFCKRYSDGTNRMMVDLLLQYLIRLS